MPGLKSLSIIANPLLSGTIPTEIGALHALRSLNIHNNTQVSGTIPAQLAEPPALRFVSLHTSSLSGTLPRTLFTQRLRYFDASANSISGLMPSFDELGSIQYLSAHSNQFSGTLSDSLGGLTGLVDRLYLHANGISGTLPPSVGNLSEIPIPALHENRISGTIPTELGLLSRLTFPAISYNMISGAIPTELAGWTSLQGRLDVLSNLAAREHYAAPRGEMPYLRNNPTLTEQGHIDANIARRTLSASTPTTWYASNGRCLWRQEPDGRFQCSLSAMPTGQTTMFGYFD